MLNIILAVDKQHGLGNKGNMAWSNKDEMLYFKTMTSIDDFKVSSKGLKFKNVNNEDDILLSKHSMFNNELFKYGNINKGKNLVLCGNKTAKTLPKKLINRKIYIISNDRSVYNDDLNKLTLDELLQSDLSKYNNIWVIGGLEIYKLFLTKYRFMCKYLFISELIEEYECDIFFNKKEYVNKNDLITYLPFYVNDLISFTVNIYDVSVEHEEIYYHKLIKSLMEQPLRENRTGIPTYSLFGKHLKFDIDNSVPLLTTKKVNHKAILEELLFFISGKTDTKILEEKGVKIWTGNTTKEFIEGKNLKYDEGDMGPMYGYQWRHFNAKYKSNETGIDQLTMLIENIKRNPYARDHLLTSYNPCQLKEGVLTPCHILAQFYIDDGISCHLYQRSADIFLGVPFNIMSYTFLTYMIGYLTGYRPKHLIISYGDVHLYSNHLEQATKMLNRKPYAFPNLKLINVDNIKTIDDFKMDNFEILDYKHHSYLSAKMAV